MKAFCSYVVNTKLGSIFCFSDRIRVRDKNNDKLQPEATRRRAKLWAAVGCGYDGEQANHDRHRQKSCHEEEEGTAKNMTSWSEAEPKGQSNFFLFN